ncbi:protein sevenless [Drosophila biarmipes]|uniref:protein sevenless n=1 Tax=Drosophila biarmipes TaxID=125945 RepID=UPI0007E630F0|nr:protein sevenless [Drosophila biarmipes]XP_043948798.1 protein sevenless [Drosophila biarmipes]XP_043948799.1 protein sevenless [Drosophila biarmipes]XP_043948800.1 protein sevenless [Drosophila biarmipes]XP_043948801.1 protein sevenless [Drosophila biarmipes]XP_050740643.1 protein sevenless [Drosophila biarmipes]
MTMFWHQNEDHQPDEESKQAKNSAPARRLNISFNVKIAVNVNTKMSTTHINQPAPSSPARRAGSPSQPGKIVVHQQSSSFDLRQQLARLGRQLASGQDGHGGISTVLIVNLLLLILLSICCDVCRSHNFTLHQSPEPVPKDQMGLLRPKLDSDVVEKVAIWHKHAAAAPPSIVEGIAISSRSRAPDPAVLPPADQHPGPHPHPYPPEEQHGVDERMVLERVTRDCVQRCIVEEDLFLDEFGIQCEKADNGEKCYKTRCTKGCAQWYRALKDLESCQDACMSLQFNPYDMPCIGACEMAQRDYWHLQRLAISHLVERTQPQLERAPRPDGQATPLTIRWAMHFPEHYLTSRPFNIQYQYVDHHGLEQEQDLGLEDQESGEGGSSAWFNLADYDCDEYFVCEILEALIPYTQYRFRFELPFGENMDEVLYSPATPAYQTPPEGAPISAPVIEHLLGLDDSHLAVHWHPGRFTNGPVEGYRLRLSSAGGNHTTEQLVPAGRGSFIFSQLQAGTNYTLELTMINKQGEGPVAKGFVETLAPRHDKPVKDLTEGVLLAGQRAVMWQSLEPAGESSMIYQSQEELADVAWSQQEQQLWLLNVHGELRSLKFDSGQMVSPAQKLKLDLGNISASGRLMPRRLTFDWLRHRLYFAMESLDRNQSKFQIISTDLEGGTAEEAGASFDLPVEQLEVDALNGWIFWRNEEALWRQDLHGRMVYRLVRIRQPGRFVVQPQHFLIRLMLPQEGKFLELSYDGGFKHPLPLPQHPSGSSSVWATFALLGSSLLLPEAGQLNLVGGQGVSASWPLKNLPDCWAVILLVADSQPLTSAGGKPHSLQALLGAQAAKISWKEPERNPYQSADAARNWSYELEVLDVASQSAFSIRNIRGPFFGLQRLQPDNLYQLRVRAMSADGEPGEWTEPLAARTWPLGPHRLRWSSREGKLLQTDELGEGLEVQREHLERLPGPMTMVNESVGYFVSGEGLLHCINLVHSQWGCPMAEPLQHVGSVTYDWRGGRVYWTDLARNCVVRMDPWSGSRELLPIFEARSLALDSRHGHLYYATSSQLSRHGSMPEESASYYKVNGLEGSIASFVLDTQQEQLYWLVGRAGTLRLYRAPLAADREALHLVHELKGGVQAVPQSLQLLRPLGALLWLEQSGRRARLVRLAAPEDVMEVPTPDAASPASALQLLDQQPLPPPDEGVIPQTVAPDTVRLDDGHWDDFHVRWQPSTSGGNHSVSYRLLLEFGQRLQTLDLTTPFARLTQLPQAQLQLRISITPRTAWRSGQTTRVQLTTPPAAPSQPRRLRVFVERMATALQEANVSALLRWDAPEQGQEAPVQALEYHISCWLGSELHEELRLNQSALEARVEHLQPDQTYHFQVEARVAATGAAAGAASHALHVAPEVQAVPRLLYANAEFIGELDLDTRNRRRLVHTASPVEHLAVIEGEQRLLWVNEHVELLTHVPGAAPAKLARMRAEVLALTVDWVQRIVYWAELDASASQAAVIYRLDLCNFEGKILQGDRVWSTASGRLLKDLVALPQAHSLLWLEYEQGSPRNGSLRGRNLTDGSELELTTLQPLIHLHAGSLEPGSETLNLVDHQGKLCVYDVARQLCTASALRAQLSLLGEDSLAMGQLAQDSGYLYALKNWSIRAYGRRRQQLEYMVELEPEEVRLLQAHNYQAYPPRSCLLLPPVGGSFLEADKCEEQGCQLHLPLIKASKDCTQPIPGVRYQLNLTLAKEQGSQEEQNEQQEQREDEPLAQWLVGAGESLNITDLLPFTRYRLVGILTSYYQTKLGLPPLALPPLELLTASATPSAPRNFSVRVLSPRELEVSWLPPKQLRSESVYYTLHWQQEVDGEDGEAGQDGGLGKPQERRLEAAGSHRLSGIKPGSGYLLWVLAHATPTKSNSSGRLHVRSFAELPELQLLELGPYSLSLSWAGTPDPLGSLQLECRSPGEQLRRNVAGNHTRMVVEPLQPRTRYQCRLLLVYAATPGAPLYHGKVEVYETLGDAPSQPGKPQLEHIAEEVFRVTWTPARGNGAPIALYNLEALQARRTDIRRRRRRRRRDSGGSLEQLPWAEEPVVVEDQWLDFCNTTELSCIVKSLHSSRLLLFRVRARSLEHGWGPYSEESERVAEPFVSPEKRGSLVLAIIAPAAIVSSCVLALVLVRKVQKRRLRAKKLLQQSRPSIWSNLSTLQTQQQLLAARNRAFSTTLSDADIALLPQINWSQLKLLRFLGSGAFGEVYEGQLQTEDSEEPQRVAIKSLRKGASEFAELLQEAQLMSNFKHENIVCLVGICFDTESISLIMEHMEAGDLLSYLRAARTTSMQDAQPLAGLSLSELLAMCIDVANGCSYLEDMHFVHRDLACRNCLVTEAAGGPTDRRRTVKIGDFGLARDIYKSDYYRKEGEGLLPVRWMSPESLVDGLFTTQSDVWAFGVLCWEILTLGQQPYAARNNFEVLAHVKEGGRLQQPPMCPEKLYALLLHCWRTDPWERPSFRRCYNSLHAISTDLRRSQMASSAAECKPEAKVRFDGESQEPRAPENLSLREVPLKDKQLYANEGVSRL